MLQSIGGDFAASDVLDTLCVCRHQRARVALSLSLMLCCVDRPMLTPPPLPCAAS